MSFILSPIKVLRFSCLLILISILRKDVFLIDILIPILFNNRLKSQRIFNEIRHQKNAASTGMVMQLFLFRLNLEKFQSAIRIADLAERQDVVG